MVELVDTPDLGSGAAMRVGSSPIRRTTERGVIRPLFSFSPGRFMCPITRAIGTPVPTQRYCSTETRVLQYRHSGTAQPLVSMNHAMRFHATLWQE